MLPHPTPSILAVYGTHVCSRASKQSYLPLLLLGFPWTEVAANSPGQYPSRWFELRRRKTGQSFGRVIYEIDQGQGADLERHHHAHILFAGAVSRPLCIY